MERPARTFFGWDAHDAVLGLVFIGLPIAATTGAWFLGWHKTAIVLGILSAIWLLCMLVLWYAMSYEGRQNAKMRRKEGRTNAREEAAKAEQIEGRL